MTCHSAIRQPYRTSFERYLLGLDPLYLPPLAEDVPWRDENHEPLVSGRPSDQRRAEASQAFPATGELRVDAPAPKGGMSGRVKEGILGKEQVPHAPHPPLASAKGQRDPLLAEAGRDARLSRPAIPIFSLFAATFPTRFQFLRPLPLAGTRPRGRALPQSSSGFSFHELRALSQLQRPAMKRGGERSTRRMRSPSLQPYRDDGLSASWLVVAVMFAVLCFALYQLSNGGAP